MNPLFTVTDLNGKDYRVFLDGHIEGFPKDATIIGNHAIFLVNFLLSLAEEAVNNGLGDVSREDFSDFILRWGLT